MGKTTVSWLDIIKAHTKLNPGKSLKAFIPDAQKEWKQVKAGLHPTKMAKTALADIKAVKGLIKSKKVRKSKKIKKSKKTKKSRKTKKTKKSKKS
jgi:hypothetical protein